MAFLQCNVHSYSLGMATNFNILLPQAPKQKGTRYPVLFLLHGLSDDATIWARRTSIERYADAREIAVVMPDGGRSFYTDMKAGLKYWTWLSEELPEIVANLFPVSTKREDTFAAGNSMGGYGSLKLALKRPDRFAGAVGLSSVADIHAWYNRTRPDHENQLIFGTDEDIDKDRNDLFALAKDAMTEPNPPKIMTICGTEDSLYGQNIDFRDHLRKLAYPGYEYREAPGAHNWQFWDCWIQEALDFLFPMN